MDEADQPSSDPEDDIDFISEDGVGGQIPILPKRSVPGWSGQGGPLFVPRQSTPLAEEYDNDALPRYALWSMKYLRRSRLFGQSEMEIRESFGSGLGTVYVMDDGRKHCLISRKVGSSADGSTYCLVAQISIDEYEQLVDGASTALIFAGAETFSLCCVFDAEDAVSNVAVVESYRSTSDLPPEYLPLRQEITFAVPDSF